MALLHDRVKDLGDGDGQLDGRQSFPGAVRHAPHLRSSSGWEARPPTQSPERAGAELSLAKVPPLIFGLVAHLVMPHEPFQADVPLCDAQR